MVSSTGEAHVEPETRVGDDARGKRAGATGPATWITRRDMIKRGSHPAGDVTAVPAEPVATMLTTSMTDVTRDSGGMLPSLPGDRRPPFIGPTRPPPKGT